MLTTIWVGARVWELRGANDPMWMTLYTGSWSKYRPGTHVTTQSAHGTKIIYLHSTDIDNAFKYKTIVCQYNKETSNDNIWFNKYNDNSLILQYKYIKFSAFNLYISQYIYLSNGITHFGQVRVAEARTRIIFG